MIENVCVNKNNDMFNKKEFLNWRFFFAFLDSIGKDVEIEKFNGVAGVGIVFQRGRK